MSKRVILPFSSFVDLDKLKLAIVINAINPKIGGLLIRGSKGSGKTSLVRSLADILPKIQTVKDCPFNCNPFDASNMCPTCTARYSKKEKMPIEERAMAVVDLPLGATEDRVIGSLDVEKAIKLGIQALEPGILAEANQNILYVDEVNLLPDHIADDLLDSAATGWNVVEREGISVSHPSRFIFIGTMNPEEGELRPQLLDRFPLSVSVTSILSVDQRTEVVKRNLEFEANPEEFVGKYSATQEELKNRIIQARELLPKVVMPEALLKAVCKTCIDLKVDGLRPDIIITKAAQTLAAFEKRTEVKLGDVLAASNFALSHRTREGGFLEPATPEEIRTVLLTSMKAMGVPMDETQKEKATEDKGGKKKDKGVKGIFSLQGQATTEEKVLNEHQTLKKFVETWSQIRSTINRALGNTLFGRAKQMSEEDKNMAESKGTFAGKQPPVKGELEKKQFGLAKDDGIPSVDAALNEANLSKGVSLLAKIQAPQQDSSPMLADLSFKAKKTRGAPSVYAGKRAETLTTLHRGRPHGWRIPSGKPQDVHLPATIRAAAIRQRGIAHQSQTAIAISIQDVRENVRTYKAPMTIVFVVDVSGSMLMNIDAVKTALLRLHGDAYRYRDRVGIVALKDTGAVIAQHPITNLRVVANKLVGLKISGYTPLATGMQKAWEVLKEAKRRDSSTIPVMVLITDGGANVPLARSLETGEIREIDEARVAVRDYEGLAVRDVLSMAKMIKRENINTIIINTNPHFAGRETYGFAVTELIARNTNGSLHTLGRIQTNKEFVESMVKNLLDDQRQIAHEATTAKTTLGYD
ncbi:MAG TPA: VWA domain-containing protein [Candidatus Bathyarchaeia archaeon]|nr:VWA domain-containing protein [Candidatus Bathyarchaeia archaeon]